MELFSLLSLFCLCVCLWFLEKAVGVFVNLGYATFKYILFGNKTYLSELRYTYKY